MPDTSKLEKLNRELEKSEKKLRKAINDEKVLQHQLKHRVNRAGVDLIPYQGMQLQIGDRVMVVGPENAIDFSSALPRWSA